MATGTTSRVRACLWPGGWFAVGPGYSAPRLHSHHAHQISIELSGLPLRIRTAADSEWRLHAAALIGADRPHAFDGAGCDVAMIFIDPESYEGRWLERSLREDITEIPEARIRPLLPRLANTLADPFDGEMAAETVEEVVKAICWGPLPPQRQDPRIHQGLAYLRGADTARVSLQEVARVVHLSPSRFAHLFSQEVGLPFRRYLLWRRLNHALLRIGTGQSFTAAAHGAGFADSAHLTRTFQQMFGLSPSLMTGTVDFYEMPVPFQRPGRTPGEPMAASPHPSSLDEQPRT
jgi:AraC-like DNA-binding protein